MWPNNNPNYPWGSWPPTNNGSFCGNDQVDWASLAKQWMRHKDTHGAPDSSRQVDVSKNFAWFPPVQPQPQTTIFTELESFNAIENKPDQTVNIQSETLVNRNMPAWAVPPPPPPLPPEMEKIPLFDKHTNLDQSHKHQNFPASWNHPNTSLFPNKMVDQSRTEFSYSTWMASSNDVQFLDAAKKKQLPAWIREGLEKMEREKCKQMEKEQEKQISEVQDINKNECYEHSQQVTESDNESENDDVQEKEASPDYKSSENISEEEKMANLMMKVRQMLTEILLEVTNDEISSIANSVYRKAKSRHDKAPQTFTLSSALASISALGNEFGSEDEDEESVSSFSSGEDPEVTQMKIDKKRAAFEAKMALWNDDREQRDEEEDDDKLNNHQVQIAHGVPESAKLNDTKNENVDSFCEPPDGGKKSFESKRNEATSSGSRSSVSSESSRESSAERRKALIKKRRSSREKSLKVGNEKMDKERGHDRANDKVTKHGKHDSNVEYSRKAFPESHNKTDKTGSMHSASTSSRSRRESHRKDRKPEKRSRDYEEKRTKRRRSSSNSSERGRSSRKDYKSERYGRRRESKSRSR